MKKWLGLVVLALTMTGCAASPETLGEIGCETADSYLPELDAAEAGETVATDLHDRIQEELRLDYFDTETRGLFQLLAEPVSDAAGESFTPVDIDYSDLRGRLISYCQSDIGWEMKNGER